VAQFLVSVEEDVEIQLPIGGQYKGNAGTGPQQALGGTSGGGRKNDAAKKDEDDSYRYICWASVTRAGVRQSEERSGRSQRTC